MTIQPIRLFGDPVLRTPADPVVDFDKELPRLDTGKLYKKQLRARYWPEP